MQLTDGERYFSNWPEVVRAYLPDSLTFGYEQISSSGINGQVLTPGEQVSLFSLKWNPATRQFEEQSRDLKLRICYSSLLEDYWLLENEERTALNRPCRRVEENEFE